MAKVMDSEPRISEAEASASVTLPRSRGRQRLLDMGRFLTGAIHGSLLGVGTDGVLLAGMSYIERESVYTILNSENLYPNLAWVVIFAGGVMGLDRMLRTRS